MERAFGTGCAKISPTAGTFGFETARAPALRRAGRGAGARGGRARRAQRSAATEGSAAGPNDVPARRHGDFVYQVKRQRGRRQPQGPAVAPLAKPLGSGRQRRQRRESIETAVENKVEVRRLHVDQCGAGLGLLDARSELGRKPARPIWAARVSDSM